MVPLDDKPHRARLDGGAEHSRSVLVTGSYLGSLSHTLTCRDAMRRRGIMLRTIVVNETPGSPVPLGETVATLARFAAGWAIIPLRRLPAAAGHAAFAEISTTI